MVNKTERRTSRKLVGHRGVQGEQKHVESLLVAYTGKDGKLQSAAHTWVLAHQGFSPADRQGVVGVLMGWTEGNKQNRQAFTNPET